jgi:hypothetical protein
VTNDVFVLQVAFVLNFKYIEAVVEILSLTVLEFECLLGRLTRLWSILAIVGKITYP